MRDIKYLPDFALFLIGLAIGTAVLLHVPEGGQGGRPTLFQLIIFLLTMVLFLNHSMTPVGKETRRLNRFLLFFAGALMVSFAGGLLNMSQADALRSDISASGSHFKILILSIFSIISCGTGYWAGYKTLGNSSWIKTILTLILIAASINGIAVIIAWIIQTNGVLGRYNFTLPIYNSYGLSATMSYTGLMMVFPLWRAYVGSFKRSLLLVAAFLCFISTLVIFSRQATVTLLVAVVLHTLLTLRRGALSKFKVVVVVAGLLVFGALVGKTMGFQEFNAWYRQLEEESDSSTSSRSNAIAGSITIFKAHPVLGVGYGYWFAYNTEIFSIVANEEVVVASPHNGLAALVSETGVVGTVLFLVMNGVALLMSWRSASKFADPFLIETGDMAFTLLVVCTISQGFSNSLIFPPSAEATCVQFAFIAWLIIGISAGIESRGPNQFALGPARRRHEKFVLGESYARKKAHL